jgi:hypothetical protein
MFSILDATNVWFGILFYYLYQPNPSMFTLFHQMHTFDNVTFNDHLSYIIYTQHFNYMTNYFFPRCIILKSGRTIADFQFQKLKDTNWERKISKETVRPPFSREQQEGEERLRFRRDKGCLKQIHSHPLCWLPRVPTTSKIMCKWFLQCHPKCETMSNAEWGWAKCHPMAQSLWPNNRNHSNFFTGSFGSQHHIYI